MKPIVYYIATSIDGYICGPEEDVSGFDYAKESDGIQRYIKDLEDFDTVIMGRKTYEFGYKYGIEPGALAYPHMEHYIFSNSLKLDNADEKLHVCKPDLATIRKLKAADGTAIYLCGGGDFAGWLLEHELIDELKIKLNPFIQLSGVPLFGHSKKIYKLNLLSNEVFDHGLQIIHYKIKY